MLEEKTSAKKWRDSLLRRSVGSSKAEEKKPFVFEMNLRNQSRGCQYFPVSNALQGLFATVVRAPGESKFKHFAPNQLKNKD